MNPPQPPIPAGLDRISGVVLDAAALIFNGPFAVAWIQRTWELHYAAAQPITIGVMAAAVRALGHGGHRAPAGSPLASPPSRQAWRQICARWPTLAQPVPGAAGALERLGKRFRLGLCAHQPRECRQALAEYGFADWLGTIALTGESDYRTPIAALLGQTVAALGLEPGRVMVVAGPDALLTGPARALGCATALLTRTDGWQAPASVHPAFAAAYRDHCAKAHAAASAADLTAADLAGLAATLCGPDPPAPGEDQRAAP